MGLTRKNILITGPPGVGKTTLVQKVYQELVELDPAGFFTKEMREKGKRVGFALEGFRGGRGTLARVDMYTPHRVGRYCVDVVGFERFLRDVSPFDVEGGIVIIDEIGKMECFSEKFKMGIVRVFDDPDKMVVATIAMKGAGLIAELKLREDVTIFRLDRKTRTPVSEQIVKEVQIAVNKWKNS